MTARKPMSAELKAAYARWSALDLQLADTQAQLAELKKREKSLQEQLHAAEQEKTRLAIIEGYA